MRQRPPVGIEAASRLGNAIRAQMASAIKDHAGNEVLFVCDVDESARVTRVRDVAHGSRNLVPAPRHAVLPGQVLVHNHPSGRLEPSDADTRLAAVQAEDGIGSWIVDNEVERLYVITEPWHEPPPVALATAELLAVLGPDGPLARRDPGWQLRPSQLAMVQLVAQAFNDGLLAALEAGTGVGKTFAYLVPALAWARENTARIVISTATINLQQQVMDKDLPVVQALLGTKIKAVLAKGRGNYVCPKRLREALEEDSLLREEDSELSRLAEWARATSDGSRSDLSWIPSDLVWSRVQADADTCPGSQCALREQCFFFKARREAATAQVVVANHSLVFADAAMRLQGLGFDGTVVLPAFRRLVFDEAHHLESSATTYFSRELNRFALAKYLNLLVRRRRGSVFGCLPLVLQHPAAAGLAGLVLQRQTGPATTSEEGDPEASADILLNLASLERLAGACRTAMEQLDGQALGLLQGEASLRLQGPAATPLRRALEPTMRQLQACLIDLTEALGALTGALEGSDLTEEIPGLLDLTLLTRRLTWLAGTCELLRNADAESDLVIWVERLRLPNAETWASFTACPLDVSALVRESILEPYDAVIMTSATLTVDGDFGFWGRRLGLDAPSQAAVPSEAPARRSEWDEYQYPDFDPSPDAPAPAAPTNGEPEPAPGSAPPAAWAAELAQAERLATVTPVSPVNLDRQLLRQRLPSPFDYAHRVLLGLPVDAPDPTDGAYADFLADLVFRACRATRGSALVLFTSYDLLSRVHEAVRPRLEREGLTVFRQGDLERSRLLRAFTEDVASVLFATESFWEGVDAPGETLRLLIITRLPFKVPTEPLQVARSQAIEARGGNPFSELSVPEAVMKFRQGFGRLMRRASDYGAVLVTDRRLATRPWGRHFLDSLPLTRRLFVASDSLLEELGAFMAAMTREPAP